MKLQQSRKPALFVDMDGTLAEWRPINVPLQTPSYKIGDYINDVLYQKGYFKTLYPYKNMVSAIKQIIEEDCMDVYILSCVLPENEKYPNATPKDDKNKWLDEHFGERIPENHRIFVKDGEPKVDNIPFELQNGDILLDDYTHNLNSWINDAPKGVKLNAIKVINPVNDTKKSWQGERISILDSPEEIKNKIYECCKIKEKIPERTKSDSVYYAAFIGMHKLFMDLTEQMLNNPVVEKDDTLYQKIRANKYIIENGIAYNKDGFETLEEMLQLYKNIVKNDSFQNITSNLILAKSIDYLEDTLQETKEAVKDSYERD